MNDLITITTIENEPRVLDTDLGEALGMSRPRDIRANVIEPNREELEGFGMIACEERAHPMPRGGFKTTTAYYLNEEQALLVCMLSRTERAKQVRAEVIRVFTAWRRGELQPSQSQLPDFSNPAEAARAWADQYDARLAAEEQVKLLEPAARVGEMACNRNYTLQRFIRTFPGVNTMQIKKDLQREGYLYRRDGTYRVYSKYRHLFDERFNEKYATVDIFPTNEGKKLLVTLYRSGFLTMKRGAEVADLSNVSHFVA